MEKIKIILADDHKVFLDGLVAVFKDHPSIEIIGIATHGEQALALLRISNPNVIVLDIIMPGLNGVETAREIIKNHPDVAILILSMNNEYGYIRSLREIGVHGYMLKGADKAELETAIKALADGREYFSREVTEIARNGKSQENGPTAIKFTKRETEVLRGLAKGWDNPEIATDMGVELSTVETHLKSIRTKTALSGARALVKYAIDNGYEKKA
jgi:DNA-binding NarL/FixJ family response regulator